MTKPTLVQTLLNRPSQTYSSLSQQQNEYHSAKQEMLRIAAAQSDPSLSEYFTPNSSPRTSMATNTSRKPSRRSLTDAVPSTRTPSASSAQRAIYALSTGSSLSSTSLDAHSIFSDYLTAAGSVDETTVMNSNYHSGRRNDEDDTRQRSRSSTTTTGITTTTTVVPVSAYGTALTRSTVTSNRSDKSPTKTPSPSPSSSVKPPPDVKASGSGSPLRGKPGTKEQERHSRTTSNANSHRPFNAFAPLPESITPVPSRQASHPPSTPARQPSTPVPSSSKQPQPNDTPPKPTRKPSPSTSKPSSATNGHAHRELPPQPKPPSSQTISSYHNRRHNNTSKIQNSIMMNMSALMEEDEDGGDGSKRPHLRHTTERGREKKKSQIPVSLASSSSSESGSITPGPTGSKIPPLHRRRSRSLDSASSRATPRLAPQTLSAEVQALTLASHGDLPSIGTPGYTSLVLPRAPMPLSDRGGGGGGLFGHFSFGLSNLNWNKLSLGADGKVDLTRSGIAQTTMASVEVVRGLSSRGGAMFGRSGSWKVLGALGRRPSASGTPARSAGPPNAARGSSSSAEDPSVKPKMAGEGTILGFTSYRAPPSYVPSQSVLVQVWAVGVDGVDGRLVGVRFGSASAKANKSEWSHEGEHEHEVGDVSIEEIEDHEFVTKSTASQNSTSRNPFIALGRSLSLSLKRPKKEPVEGPKSQLGRSFSLKPSKKPDINSVSISTPAIPVAQTKQSSNANATLSRSGSVTSTAVGQTKNSSHAAPSRSGSTTSTPVVAQTKHSSNAHATPSRTGSATSTPEKKRSGSQLHHQRSKHQEVSTTSPLATPPKLPSKPQKLKATKTKAVPVPGVQVHVETHVQPHSTPISRDKQPTGAPALKERQLTPASISDQNNQPRSPPTTSKSKPRLLPRMPSQPPAPKPAEVGFVPGRSFVGRVLEVGWELGDEVIRKGEWVVGLVDVRKCGALAEFIVVDRHRIHRVPHPRRAIPNDDPNAAPAPLWVGSPLVSSPQLDTTPLWEGDLINKRDNRRDGRNDQTSFHGDGNVAIAQNTRSPTNPPPVPMLTLEEMALIPLCGIPAYRAVLSFMYAFSGDARSPTSDHHSNQSQQQHRRRALVLRGHDGAGAMAVQMLIRRGWRISVHVPFSCVPPDATQELADGFMRAVEDRAREWGADEVIFDDGEAEDGDDGRAAAVRVIETLREEGDVFDAILDTVGGREVREAGERLLRSNGSLASGGSVPVSPLTSPTSAQGFPTFSKSKRRGIGLFTTLVGDTPERPIPSAADAFRANLRSFRFGSNDNHRAAGTEGTSSAKANGANASSDNDGSGPQAMVGYAWVSVAHEVSEWEGADVRETLGAVLALAMEDGIRPLVEDVGGGMLGRPRVVPFEKTPGVFVDNGTLGDGGTLVVRIAG